MFLAYICGTNSSIYPMPLTAPNHLPSIKLLEQENIFVMNNQRALTQDIRPLKVAILNLMPLKIDTETDLLRIMSNTPLQVDITLLRLRSHLSKNTPQEHLDAFYRYFDEVKNAFFDGLIVTGAPVENIPFEEVGYWKELCDVFSWARHHVTSSLFICWGAQSALYWQYAIPKYPLSRKLFGVYEHRIIQDKTPLFRGFDDFFWAPHSRHTEVKAKDIEQHHELQILSQSEEAGVYIVVGRQGRELYVMGHAEYNSYTLHNEYIRDMKRGANILPPENYYLNDDHTQKPLNRWRGHGNMLFYNWINYYLYQATPFDPSQIALLKELNV